MYALYSQFHLYICTCMLNVVIVYNILEVYYLQDSIFWPDHHMIQLQALYPPAEKRKLRESTFINSYLTCKLSLSEMLKLSYGQNCLAKKIEKFLAMFL